MSEVTKDMIGCLCWFFDKGCEKDLKNIDILEEVDEYGNVYSKHTCAWWECCRPVKSDEIKLFRDADDMLNNYVGLCKIGELKARIKELEKENRELKERFADDSKTIYTYRGKQISALDYYLGKAKETLEEIKELKDEVSNVLHK